MKLTLSLTHFIFFLLCGMTVQSQSFIESEAGLPYIRNFYHYEYKADRENWSIVQDQRGFIYSANNDGILEYDGSTWRFIKVKNESGVRWLTVWQNRIFVAAQNELGYLTPDKNGEYKFASLMDSIPSEFHDFTDVWENRSADDGVYFRSKKYLFRWNGQQMKVWTIPAGGKLFDTMSMINGKIFLRIGGLGIYTIKNDELELLPNSEKFAELKVNGILPFRSGEFIVATRLFGLFHYDGKTVKSFAPQSDYIFKKNTIYDVLQLENGDFAFATFFSGVFITDSLGNFKAHFNKENGLADIYTTCLMQDTEGGLWVGSGQGISRIDMRSAFTFFNEKNGLKGNVKSITRHKGDLYFSTSYAVYRLAKKSSEKDELTTNRVIQITEKSDNYASVLDLKDRLLISGYNGSYEYKSGRLTPITNLPNLGLFHFEQFPDLVFSIKNEFGLGVFKILPNQTKFLGYISDFDQAVSYVAIKGDSIWLSFAYKGIGLYRLDYKQLTENLTLVPLKSFGLSEGLPSLISNKIFQFNGQIYSSSQKGFLRYNSVKNHFEPVNEWNKKIPENLSYIHNIVPYGNKFLVLHGSERMFSTSVFNPENAEFKSVTFMNPSDNNYSTIFTDQSDIIWFGGDDKLIRFNSNQAEFEHPLLKSYIRTVKLTGVDSVIFYGFQNNTSPKIEYGLNSLRIEFSTPEYDNPQQIQYQYRLVNGSFSEWSNWSTENYKDFTNLTEHSYRFEVRAKNVTGKISETAEYSFVILPPWYRTWWMFSLASLLTIGVGLAYNYYRTRKLREENEILEKVILDKSSRLAQVEKHSAINQLTAGLAHEINNPLTIIQMNAELLNHLVSNPATETKQDEIKKSTQALVESTGRIKAIINKMKTFTELTEVSDEFDCRVIIDQCISNFKNQYKNILFTVSQSEEKLKRRGNENLFQLVIFNIVNNSVQAVMEKMEKSNFSISGQITVITKSLNNEIRIIISDNGIGISPEILNKIFDPFFTTKEIGNGIGLGLTESYSIVKSMSGSIHTESEPNKGTTVTLSFPK